MKRFVCCFVLLLICLPLSACTKWGVKDKTANSSSEPAELNTLDELLRSGEWIEKAPPKLYSNEWYDANYSKEEYKVEYVNNILVGKAEPRESVKYEIHEGVFEGTDHGEWGGELLFYPNNDFGIAYKVTGGNIVDIIGINNQILVFEGLAHLTLSEGRVLKLIKKNNKWTAEESINLGDAPFAVTKVNENTIYVVTCSKLLVIKDEKISETIIDDAFWESLYPNSIIYDKGFIYIGMRKGLAKVNLTNKKVTWIVKKN